MTSYHRTRTISERIEFRLDGTADGGRYHADDVWHLLQLAHKLAESQYGSPAVPPRGVVRVEADDTALTVTVDLPGRPRPQPNEADVANIVALVDWTGAAAMCPGLDGASTGSRAALVRYVLSAVPIAMPTTVEKEDPT